MVTARAPIPARPPITPPTIAPTETDGVPEDGPPVKGGEATAPPAPGTPELPPIATVGVALESARAVNTFGMLVFPTVGGPVVAEGLHLGVSSESR